MTLPVLSVTVHPLPDETMRSWVDRLAARHRVSVAEMLTRLGLADGPRVSDIPRGYGLVLPRSALADAAVVAEQSLDELDSLLVQSMAGSVLPAGWDPLQRNALQWVYRAGSHYCPACLAERDGAWRRTWKTPWSFACLEHGLWLRSHCPSCGSRAASERKEGNFRPELPLLIPRPDHCGAATGFGRSIKRCGADLTASDAINVPPSLRSTQETLNQAMTTRRGVVASRDVDGPAFFEAMRAVAALWLHAGIAEDFDFGDRELRDAVDAHLDRRSLADRARAAHHAAGHSPHATPKTRFWRTTPETPGLMAAISHLALPIVTDTGSDGVAVLAARLRSRSVLNPKALEKFHVPHPIATALLSQPRPRITRVRWSVEVGPGYDNLEVRHIPSLFWSDLYAAKIDPYFQGIRRSRGLHRFASVALARHVSGLSLPKAAAATGNNDSACYKGLIEIRREGKEAAFDATLASIAAQLNAAESLVDYAERRRRYKSWSMCHADSRLIYAQSVRPMADTHLHLSSHAWALVVGGFWAAAPCWLAPPTAAERLAHTRFLRCDLKHLGQSLDAFIASVLSGDRTAFEAIPIQPVKVPPPSVSAVRPDLVPEWDAELNAPHLPSTVGARADRLIWWRCRDCGEVWRESASKRCAQKRGPGCESCREKTD